MEFVGIGILYLVFERLKKELFLEGLFDNWRKMKFLKIYKKIGLIICEIGVVLRDMINIFNRSYR
jgi:Exonuclease VII, large subunit